MLHFKNEKALLSLLISLGFFSSNTSSQHDVGPRQAAAQLSIPTEQFNWVGKLSSKKLMGSINLILQSI